MILLKLLSICSDLSGILALVKVVQEELVHFILRDLIILQLVIQTELALVLFFLHLCCRFLLIAFNLRSLVLDQFLF